MACKLKIDLDNSARFKDTSEAVFDFVHSPQFIDLFGDWLSGVNTGITSKEDPRLDEFGYPTIKSVADIIDSNDIKIEIQQESTLLLGTEYQEATRDKVITDLIKRVKTRIKNLRTAKKIQMYGAEELQSRIENATSVEEARKIRIDYMRSKYVTDLEALSSQLEKFNDKVAVKAYLKTVELLLKNAKQVLNIEGALDIATIYEYDQRLKFINTVDEVIQLLSKERDLELYVTKDNTGGKGIDYNKILSDKASIQAKFNYKAREAISNKWGSLPGKMTALYFRKYEDAFSDQKQGGVTYTQWRKSRGLKDSTVDGSRTKTRKLYQEAKSKFVADQMERNADLIKDAEVNNYMRILKDNPRDISGFAHYMLDARNMGDDIISLAAELLDKKDYLTMRKTVEKVTELEKLWSEYIKGKSSTDMRSLWGDMIGREESGKLTKFLVDEIKPEFWTERQKFLKPMLEAQDKYGVNSYQYIEAKKEYIEWYNENVESREKDSGKYNVKSKWKDSRFAFFADENNKNKIEYKMYWFFRDMITERDEKYPNRRGLKLPAIQKTLMETSFEDGLIPAIKRIYKDNFTLTADDIDYYEKGENNSEDINKWEQVKALMYSSLDEYGQVQQKIPVYYRQDDKVPISEQSYDLPSILLMDYWGSVNYEESTYVQAELEILKQVVGSSKVGKYHWGKKKAQKIKVKGEEQLSFEMEEGVASNVYKNLTSVIEDRLYGIKSIGSGKLNKLAGTLMAWTSDTMLIFNYYSAIASVFQSKTIQSMRAMSGMYFDVEYGMKEIIQAEKKFGLDMGNILGDVGLVRPGALTNLLGERFQAEQDWNPAAKRFMAATKLSQSADKSTLHGFHQMGEHYVQHLLMYSFLNGIKIKNSKGQYINRDGKVVKDRNQAMSFDEVYEAKEKELKVREGLDIGSLVFKTGRIIKVKNNNLSDAEFKVTRHLFELNYYVNGNYTSKNNAYAQRTIIGKAAYALRRWMIPGGLEKYRGADKMFTPREDLRADDLEFSRQSDELQFGMFTEAMRYVNTMIRQGELLKAEMKADRWNSMSERERGDIRRATIYIVEMFLSGISSSLLLLAAKAAPDDEEKKLLLYGAFFVRRLYSELSFYMNPQELLRILRSPAASISMIENAMELFLRFFGKEMPRLITGNGFETYTRGKRKGKTKIGKEVRDVLPILKQLDRDVENSLKFLYGNNS